MKCYLINGKQVNLFCSILLLVTGFCLFAQNATVPTMAQYNRDLPIYGVECEQKQVALTINCAWGDEDIPDLLSTLQHEQVTATFFMVGEFVSAHPDSVALIANAGHSIQNHSDTHADFQTLTADEIVKEVTDCNQKIQSITGKAPTMVRCPSGSYNDLAIQTIRSLEMEAIQWSLDSLDWHGTTVDEMQARILPNLTSGDILLFHNDTAHTAEALPVLIDEMKQAGYQFVTVDDLLPDTPCDIALNGWMTNQTAENTVQ